MTTFLQKHLDDVLIVSGSGVIVLALALYVSALTAILAGGIILVVLGVVVGIGNGRIRK